MRYSKQRETILAVVNANPVHPTADQVYLLVRQTLPNISLGTVYRNLNRLVTSGRLTVIPHDGVTHYDGNTDDHLHFICDSCRRIFDIDYSSAEFLSAVNRQSEHQITGASIHLTGICADCQQTQDP